MFDAEVQIEPAADESQSITHSKKTTCRKTDVDKDSGWK